MTQPVPGINQVPDELQEIIATTLAAGPAGGCVSGHGCAARITLLDGVPYGLTWQHGRAPAEYSGGRLQVGDELQLGTIAEVVAHGDDTIAEIVQHWLKTIVHAQADRGLGWTRCRTPDVECFWLTQREGGICWQHAEPTQRELDFGSVGSLLDRPPITGGPVL